MQVMLRNLPESTSRTEILKFIAPHLSGGLFRPKGVVRELSFLAMRNTQTKLTEYHGVVRIEPDSAALRVIKNLNAKNFKGRYIAVREFATRGRNLGHKQDRRRDLIIQEVSEPVFSSRAEFHRVFSSGG